MQVFTAMRAVHETKQDHARLEAYQEEGGILFICVWFKFCVVVKTYCLKKCYQITEIC